MKYPKSKNAPKLVLYIVAKKVSSAKLDIQIDPDGCAIKWDQQQTWSIVYWKPT